MPGRERIAIMSSVAMPYMKYEPERLPELEEHAVTRARRAGIHKHEVMDFGGAPGCQGCIVTNKGNAK